MITEGKPIEELSEETKLLLRASVAIPTLAVLIRELVYNSIDNNASCVAVRVFLGRDSRLEVIDNGTGVENLADLCEEAPGNQRKISRRSYGTKRGCLYYITRLCTKVGINTRRFTKTRMKTFRSYQEGSQLTEECRARHSVGTTVVVAGIFSNMPVRAVSMSYMDLEDAREELLKVALANPTVAITLKDTESGNKILQTFSSRTPLENFLIYSSYRQEWETFREVKGEFSSYNLSGLISTEMDSKVRQLVFVNRRPVADSRLQRFTSDLILSARREQVKRNQENQFPVFVIFLTCKSSLVDMCFESNTFAEFADWNAVFTLIYQTVRSFLEAEGVELPVSQEEVLSSIGSPAPSLRTKLRVMSPPNNVRSERAMRKAALAARVTEATPKKASTGKKKSVLRLVPETPPPPPPDTDEGTKIAQIGHISESPPITDARNSNDITPTKLAPLEATIDLYTTPPTKSTTCDNDPSLQNAPVLNHLLSAKKRLDLLDEKENELENMSSLKRRSSTPLFPSRVKIPMLNLSPISTRKSNEVRFGKQKRRRNSRSDSICFPRRTLSRQDVDADDELLFKTDSASRKRVRHPDTQSVPKEPEFDFVLTKDSGYDTSNRQLNSLSFSRTPLEPQIQSAAKPKFTVFEDPIEDPPRPAKPFEVYHDSFLKPVDDEGEKKTVDTGCSPVRFTQLQEKASPEYIPCTDEEDHVSDSLDDGENSQEGNSGENSQDDLFSSTQDGPSCNSYEIVFNYSREPTSVMKSQDALIISSLEARVEKPGEAPTSQGAFISSSPGNTLKNNQSALTKDPEEDPEKNLEMIPEPVVALENVCSTPNSQDALISSSIDEFIDQAVENATREGKIATDKLLLDGVDFQGCLQCSTQQVKQRLNFASQKKPETLLQQRPQPSYQIASPIAAASHITADCTAWNKPKITLKRTTSNTGVDIRKWRSGVFETHGETALDAQRPLSSMKFLIDSCKFTKEVFRGLRVTGQLDNKFIGCVTGEGMLVVVDQHAAHERVRLECILAGLYKEGDESKGVVRAALAAPIAVSELARAERQFVRQMTEKFEMVGFKMDLGESAVKLTEVPKVCFTESGELNIAEEELGAAFRDAVEQIRSSRGANLSLPFRLTDYMHSRACHGAIRFGDELSLAQCQALLEQLSACDLPFQCAHGRPSFAPIVQLNPETERVTEGLQFLKLRSHASRAADLSS